MPGNWVEPIKKTLAVECSPAEGSETDSPGEMSWSPTPDVARIDGSLRTDRVVDTSSTRAKGVSFVELRDIAPGSEPKIMQRKLLKRSSTLSSLQDVARGSAAEKNNFKGYVHYNWFSSIPWIFKGSGMNVFFLLGFVTAYAIVVVIIVETTGTEDAVDVGTDVTVGIGGCMALLLAFRLNVCYSRWWEGRLLWGRVIESARSLVTMSLSLEADAEPRSTEAAVKRAVAETLAGWSILFAIALKFHLREAELPRDAGTFKSIERLLNGKGSIVLGGGRSSGGQGAAVINRLRSSAHPPLHALRCIRHAIRRVIGQMRLADVAVTAVENSLNNLSGEMHGALTGCERILRTPCPPGYVGVLRVSLLFFLMLLPFVLLEIGYFLIPVVFCTAFVLLGAEEVAIQLEQPFGDDQNDLPLDFYCFTLEADLMTLLDENLEDDDVDDSNASDNSRNSVDDLKYSP